MNDKNFYKDQMKRSEDNIKFFKLYLGHNERILKLEQENYNEMYLANQQLMKHKIDNYYEEQLDNKRRKLFIYP